MRLALAVRSGDHDAYRALYDRYAGPVLGVAQAVVRDRAVAEDIVHDVFLNFWRNPEAYEPARGQFVAWLLRVTRNRAIDILRKRKPLSLTATQSSANGMEVDATNWIPDGDPLPDLQAITTTVGEEVRRALRELPPDHRRLLELAYFGGLTQREIALKTGKPLGTVKTQMRTSLMRLAKLASIQNLATSVQGEGFVEDERSLTTVWQEAAGSRSGSSDAGPR